MLSNNSSEPQPNRDAKDGEVPFLNPQDPIEVASAGNGTSNDPAGTDTRPPGYNDLELLG